MALSQSFLTQLYDCIDSSRILSRGLESYGQDRTPGEKYLPELVLVPAAAEEIGPVLALANEHKVPVTVRGAGTGTTGGALPVSGGIVMSLSALDRILEIDQENRMAVVEPGVITADLHHAVEAVGLFYPPDPASLGECTIGGNVAENAGGPRAVKYGVTGDYVVGLEGFFVDGMPFKFGGKLLKNVAGYDVLRLLVGSEGTLAVVTRITLRLLPLPTQRMDVLAVFDDVDHACRALTKVHALRLRPAIAEFMDQTCVKAVEDYLGDSIFFSDAPAIVIFQVDGTQAPQVRLEAEQICEACREVGVRQVLDIHDRDRSDHFWQIRRAVSPALTAMSRHKVSEDIAIPPASIPEYMATLPALGKRYKLLVLGYGHLGDGNVHVNILNMDQSEAHWLKVKDKAIHEVLESAVKLGGTITGEHGVGLTKKPYLSLMFKPHEILLMKNMKRVFDPNAILNPGKIL